MRNSVASFIDNNANVETKMISEASAGTETKATFANQTVTLRKAMTLAPVTGELIRFSTLADITSEVFRSMGLALSKKLQYLIFNSQGNSGETDGSITGIIKAMGDVDPNKAVLRITGDNWSNFNAADDVGTIFGKIASWANSANYSWYCHRALWGSTLESQARALSGNTYSTITGQKPQAMLASFPVKFVDQMPSEYRNGEIALLFGDLSGTLATADINQTFIDSSKDFYFDKDTVVLRSIKHIGVNCWAPGTSTKETTMVAVRFVEGS